MAARKTFRIRFTGSGVLLSLIGAAALLVSVVYASNDASTVLAFIGLGLIFWGVILTYIQSEDYVRGNVLKATALPILSTLNEALDKLDYNGKPVYLPPKYLNEPDETMLYLSKEKEQKLPTPEQIQKIETQPSSMEFDGLLITPPGANLASLFEKTLGTNFSRTDLNYLVKSLPKLVIGDLEIATDLQITPEVTNSAQSSGTIASQRPAKANRIRVEITDSIYGEISRETETMSRIVGNIGDPLTSAIAVAITKSTGRPMCIMDEKTTTHHKKEVEFLIYNEEWGGTYGIITLLLYALPGTTATITNLSMLLAVCAVVLLITSELLSPHYGRVNIKIDRKRLRNTAILFSALFLATAALRIATTL